MAVCVSSTTVSVATPPTDSESRAADEGRAPTPEAGVVAILATADDVVKEALLVQERVVRAARVLEASVEEGLGRLDEGNARIVHVAEGPLEEVRQGDMVCVEDEKKVRLDVIEGVVQVPGLRVLAGFGP